MDSKSFEETKKKYEDEIIRLNTIAEATQELYQRQYNDLKAQEKALLDEFNTKMQNITVGIERLRGAYTALADMEEGKEPTLVTKGMMQDEAVQEDVSNEADSIEVDNIKEDNVDISKDVKDKAKKLVKKAIEKDLVTPYEEFVKSELGKETAVKDVKEVVSEEGLAKLHQSGEVILSDEESEALKKVIEESKIISSADENISKKEDTPKKESTPKKEDTSNTQPAQNVNPDDVPDYLKEQYGMK